MQRASLASEMWSRVYDMHAQQQRDRRLRSRFLVLELLLLAVTLFSLVRVGMPELLCPERFEDGEEAGEPGEARDENLRGAVAYGIWEGPKLGRGAASAASGAEIVGAFGAGLTGGD